MPEIPSKPRVTLKDIARASGISLSVVGRALQNSTRVAPETRKRVETLARKMGYQPNALAVGLAHFKQTSRTKPVQAVLGWLIAWPKSAQLRSFREFDRYWQGALKAAEKLGYRLEEFEVNDQMPPRRLEQILLTRNISGILIPPMRSVVDWTGFDWKQFSAVRFDRATSSLPQFPLVTSAQSANAILAFNKIREKGYKRIGFVGHRTCGWTFLGGFLQLQTVDLPKAMQIPPMLFEKQIPATQQFVNWDTKETLQRFISWLNRWKPDAILTEEPVVLALLKKAGRRVPEDIGVAGLNVLDMPFDAGIYQNPEEIGRVATLVVISLINDNDRGIPALHREILVKGNWVDGNSLPSRV